MEVPSNVLSTLFHALFVMDDRSLGAYGHLSAEATEAREWLRNATS